MKNGMMGEDEKDMKANEEIKNHEEEMAKSRKLWAAVQSIIRMLSASCIS